MKEQDKTPEEELSEVEVSDVSDKEFKLIIIKMFKEPERRVWINRGKYQKFLTKR